MIGTIYPIILLTLTSINSFKSLLDEHWKNFIYDLFYINLGFTGCAFFLYLIITKYSHVCISDFFSIASYDICILYIRN